jgi:large subunit ribosomal protein L13
MKEHIIDAGGKKLGRIASKIASLLLGKTDPSFQKNKITAVKVKVINAAQMDITNKKTQTKIYTNYSGYPGGLKKKSLSEIVTNHGYAEILKRAVSGMIHNTKLKNGILKNLTISE